MGDTKTFDQKRFIILGRRAVDPSIPIEIDFFVKFDEFEELPKIKSISVDGVPVCISGISKLPTYEIDRQHEIDAPSEKSTIAQRSKDILLSDLPFHNFPGVTLIQQQVNNVSVSQSFEGFQIF